MPFKINLNLLNIKQNVNANFIYNVIHFFIYQTSSGEKYFNLKYSLEIDVINSKVLNSFTYLTQKLSLRSQISFILRRCKNVIQRYHEYFNNFRKRLERSCIENF